MSARRMRSFGITILAVAISVSFGCAGANGVRGQSTSKKAPERDDAKVADNQTTFIGTVRSIHYLSTWEGKAFLTHFDPRFILVVDIESVSPPDSLIKTGLQAFAIHSPTLLFGRCRIPEPESVLRPKLYGMKFAFSVARDEKDERIFWLEMRDLSNASNQRGK